MEDSNRLPDNEKHTKKILTITAILLSVFLIISVLSVAGLAIYIGYAVKIESEDFNRWYLCGDAIDVYEQKIEDYGFNNPKSTMDEYIKFQHDAMIIRDTDMAKCLNQQKIKYITIKPTYTNGLRDTTIKKPNNKQIEVPKWTPDWYLLWLYSIFPQGKNV